MWKQIALMALILGSSFAQDLHVLEIDNETGYNVEIREGISGFTFLADNLGELDGRLTFGMKGAITRGNTVKIVVSGNESGKETWVGLAVDGTFKSATVLEDGMVFEASPEASVVVFMKSGDESVVRIIPVTGDNNKDLRVKAATAPLGIRFLVRNPADGLWYEILPGSVGTGFRRSNRGTSNGFVISGTTSRVQRGETIATLLLGSGTAQSTILVNGRQLFPMRTFNLPDSQINQVTTNTSFDNLTVPLIRDGQTIQQRVSIGTR